MLYITWIVTKCIREVPDICLFLTNGSNPHNFHFKAFKETHSILENVVVFDFKLPILPNFSICNIFLLFVLGSKI